MDFKLSSFPPLPCLYQHIFLQSSLSLKSRLWAFTLPNMLLMQNLSKFFPCFNLVSASAAICPIDWTHWMTPSFEILPEHSSSSFARSIFKWRCVLHCSKSSRDSHWTRRVRSAVTISNLSWQGKWNHVRRRVRIERSKRTQVYKRGKNIPAKTSTSQSQSQSRITHLVLIYILHSASSQKHASFWPKRRHRVEIVVVCVENRLVSLIRLKGSIIFKVLQHPPGEEEVSSFPGLDQLSLLDKISSKATRCSHSASMPRHPHKGCEGTRGRRKMCPFGHGEILFNMLFLCSALVYLFDTIVFPTSGV